MADGPTNTSKQTELEHRDSEFTKIVLLGLVGVLIAATLSVGVNAAYFLLALGAVGSAIYYHNNLQEWFSAHQMVWIGAATGFFFGGASFGPIGMALGAWVGQFAEQQINNTIKVVNTVTAPVTYAKQTSQSLWNSLQSGINQAYQFVAPQIAPQDPPPPEKETPAAPIAKQKRAPIPETNENPEPSMQRQLMQRKKTTLPTAKVTVSPGKKRKSEAPFVKEAPSSDTNKGCQIWQRFSNFFTRQPAVKAPQKPLVPKASRTVTWQQKMAKNQSKVEEQVLPSRRLLPILTIM